MGKVQYITHLSGCQKVVEKLLLKEDLIAVAAKHICIDKPEEVMLLMITTANHHTYIFDIKKEPKMLHEGLLWRLLVAPAVTKVMHDCRYLSSVLHKQFGITLHNVFDTQAAYCVMMIHSGLPPRLIPLDYLYHKYGDSEQKYIHNLQSSICSRGLDWAQRPLAKSMLHEAAADSQCLMSQLYTNLRSQLTDIALEHTEELCYAYINRRFKQTSASRSQRDGTQEQNVSQNLSKEQANLLYGTVPQAATSMHVPGQIFHK